ncbi:MAG: CDGSH iron-sulfur domain-containing protein [Gloeocapsa sp. UFS-A4-WI-NPMV-4B04]|jgi:CDGSH-type Zn-finger protein|nr:CDGSH iron-sulfur domain-containing protein [Gloeocapsa sp. UFS-A4-WI-NPMV-4B04]
MIMTQETFTIPLEAGTYYICTCGQSKNLPYCDGSHQGTGLQPLALELESTQTVEISGLPEAKSSR